MYVFRRSSLKNLSPVSLIDVWTLTHILATAVLHISSLASSSAPNLNAARNWFATAKSALSGQPRYLCGTDVVATRPRLAHETRRLSHSHIDGVAVA